MTEKYTAIVLGTIRHSDRSDITTFFTRERARLALAVGSGSGATARLRRGMLMPLSIVELTARLEVGRDVGRLLQVSTLHTASSIYMDPIKTSVAMFVAEFIGRLVRESPPDSGLWDYLSESFRLLGIMSGGRTLANFPLVLLASLASFCGISPDVGGFQTGRMFDMRSGCFVDMRPAHGDIVEAAEAGFVVTLSRLNFANSRGLRLSREARRRILDDLLRYYALHLPGLGEMKSPAVLREILS